MDRHTETVKKTKKPSGRINVTLPYGLHVKVLAEAEKEGRDPPDMIRVLLEQAFFVRTAK